MTKTKRTLTTVVLFAITLICAIAFFATNLSAKTTFADTTAGVEGTTPATTSEYYNLYDINQATWPNPNAKTDIEVQYDDDEDATVFAISNGFTGNYILRNSYMYFESGITYTVSYKIKTVVDQKNSANWRITTRAAINYVTDKPMVDGSVKTISATTNPLTTEWQTIEYSFTATETSSSAESSTNYFDIVFEKFEEDDIVLIKDMRVEFPKSAYATKGVNLFNGKLKPANPDQELMFKIEDVQDPEYGTVKKFAMQPTWTKNDVVNTTTVQSGVFMRTEVQWKEGVTYHVSYMYKTERSNGTNLGGYSFIRCAGKQNATIGGGIFYANGAGLSVTGSQWKMFNYTFTVSDLTTGGTNTGTNVFEIVLERCQPGDVLYVADLSIFAACVEHDYKASYTWSADNTTCTAKQVCSKCTKVGETETVTATAGEDTATCTAAGTITYTATFTNSAFTAQTKDVDTAAKGHTYGTDATYTWNDDNTVCTASGTCTACNTPCTETATITSSTTPATCTEAEKTTYTATFANTTLTTQTKTIDGAAAKGHTYGEATYTWNDETHECTAKRTCTVDGCTHEETETVTATASEDTATCTAAGKITYTATFTNTAFAVQTKNVDTAAKGHDYKDGKCTVCEAADPDYTKEDNSGEGNATEEKSGCGSSISATSAIIPLLLVALASVVIIKKNSKKQD